MVMSPPGCSPLHLDEGLLVMARPPSAPNPFLSPQRAPSVNPVATAQLQPPLYNPHPSALTQISPFPHPPPCNLFTIPQGSEECSHLPLKVLGFFFQHTLTTNLISPLTVCPSCLSKSHCPEYLSVWEEG